MIITIRNRWLLRAFWKRWHVPPYVTASHKLWLRWLFTKGVPVSRVNKQKPKESNDG